MFLTYSEAKEILKSLKALPSGLSDDQRAMLPRQRPVDPRDHRSFLEAKVVEKLFSEDEKEATYNDVLVAYATAVEDARHKNDPLLLSRTLCQAGIFRLSAGEPEQALPLLSESYAIETGYTENEGREAHVGEHLYLALHHVRYAPIKRSRAAGYNYFDREMTSVRTHLAEIWPFAMNGAHDPTARHIEQGEIGFSDSQKIGTLNVRNCLAVMLRDPVTSKTALAHCAQAGEIQDMQRVVDEMCACAQGRRLQARLVGSNFMGIKDDTPMARDSMKNVVTMVHHLRQRPVDIVSADLFDMENPANITVSPLDFSLRQEIGSFNAGPDLFRRIAGTFSGIPNHLHVAFDLTHDSRTNPVFLSRELIPHMEMGYSLAEASDFYVSQMQEINWNISDVAAMLPAMLSLRDTYKKAKKRYQDVLDEAIEKKLDKGYKLSPVVYRGAREWVRFQPVYLGEGAETEHAPFYDFIRHDLFISRQDGRLALNETAMETFRFPQEKTCAVDRWIARNRAQTGMKNTL